MPRPKKKPIDDEEDDLYTGKNSEEGYQLRVHVYGSFVDVISPIPREQFITEMSDEIEKNSARTDWNGWFTLKKTDGKPVTVQIRGVSIVEEL